MNIRTMIALLVITVALILTGTVAVVTRAENSRNSAQSVSQWNDGYATAMRDLCQDQHDSDACAWMAQNNGGK